jgi:hypothetical protein
MATLHTVSVVLLTLGLLGGCGHDDDAHAFENLTECVVDHASLGEPQSIAHCLVDFPELHPTFADQAACVAWVTENGGYPNSRDAACVDYFLELEAG